MKRPGALIAVALAVGVAIAGVAVAVRDQPSERFTGRAGRVLVISLPHVTWSDLEGPDVPNIDRLVRQSSIASLTTRTVSRTDLVDGYVTVGAGTRASGGGRESDGEAFGVHERIGDETAEAVFERQTGEDVDRGIVHLGLAAIHDVNEDEGLDATVGSLGDALRRAGHPRAVVANGDGESPASGPPDHQRMAVTALMTTDGKVPAGQVDAGLLVDDPTAPFGQRLGLHQTVAAFEEAWDDDAVVLVEASDLVRATRHAPFAVKGRSRVLFKDALRASDRLVGELLDEVDPRRDAVMVLSPVPSALGQKLTMVSVRAPGVEPGLLRAPSLRRAGYVQIVDVAPTILDLVDVPRPAAINGRPMSVEPTDRSASERRQLLLDGIDASEFRNAVANPVIGAFVALQVALAIGAVLVMLGRLGEQARARVRFGALVVLGFVPAVYFARLLPFHETSFAYPPFLVAAAFVLALVYRHLGRRHELDSPIVALAAIAVLLVADVMLGAWLQLNSAFGYTPTVGVRISGFGNVSFAALSSSAVLLAGLLAHRIRGRPGVVVAVTVLATAFLADAAPIWGADVGGVLSMIPAFGVTAVLLSGRTIRFRPRTVLVCVVAAVVGVAVAAALDLSQPEEQRTHLGRFIEQVRDEGLSRLVTTTGQKLSQNLATITSIWGLMLPGVLAFLAYLSFVSRRLAALVRRVPELRSALIGFTILATLGYMLNDSGISVPSMMLGLLNPTLVVLLVRRTAAEDDRPVARPTRARA